MCVGQSLRRNLCGAPRMPLVEAQQRLLAAPKLSAIGSCRHFKVEHRHYDQQILMHWSCVGIVIGLVIGPALHEGFISKCSGMFWCSLRHWDSVLSRASFVCAAVALGTFRLLRIPARTKVLDTQRACVRGCRILLLMEGGYEGAYVSRHHRDLAPDAWHRSAPLQSEQGSTNPNTKIDLKAMPAPRPTRGANRPVSD